MGWYLLSHRNSFQSSWHAVGTTPCPFPSWFKVLSSNKLPIPFDLGTFIIKYVYIFIPYGINADKNKHELQTMVDVLLWLPLHREGVQIALGAPSDYQLCKRGHFSTPKLCMKWNKKCLDNFQVEIKNKIWIQNSLVVKVYEMIWAKRQCRLPLSGTPKDLGWCYMFHHRVSF